MLSHEDVLTTLTNALGGGAEFAEVFAEDVQRMGVSLDDGRIESISSSRDRGVGIRVMDTGAIGFAHSSNLTPAGLSSTAETAAGAAKASRGAAAPAAKQLSALNDVDVKVAAVKVRPEEVDKQRKVELLQAAEDAARSADPSITQVSVGYADQRRKVMVANSDGTLANDDQTKTRFSVSCIATGDTGLQTGRESVGTSGGFELFDSVDVEELARDAAHRALIKLRARPAPSGALPVVIGPGSGGVLFHEACGHGLEADLVRKGASAFAGRLGEQVASPLVTLVDDGTMAGEWGQFGVDDEGNLPARNVLIENGVLVDYMWDSIRARKEGRASSGNGRRQSYRHLPMVRMTNTYLSAGDSTPADIISSVDHGVYVAQLGGGQVNTASGDFVFGMVEAYMIEDGKISTPLRDGQLVGNGPKVLQQIEAVGDDFEMGPPGTCGKDGQGVPVGDGVPTLKVAELTIGGTAG